MSEEDIHKGLIVPPPIKMIVDESGKMIKMATLSDVLTPKYRRCKTCAARYRCPRVQRDSKGKFLDADCVIEKDILDVLLTRLTLDGVTIQDEMLLFPLVRVTFQLARLYELETVIDLAKILRDDDAMKTFKGLNSVTTKLETQQLKYLKELMATKKEDHKRSVKTIKGSKTIDFALKLQKKNVELQEKKNANKKK